MIIRCAYCNYQWQCRVQQPKECPECKRRLHLGEDEIKDEPPTQPQQPNQDQPSNKPIKRKIILDRS